MMKDNQKKQGNVKLIFLSVLFIIILITTTILNRCHFEIYIGIGRFEKLETGPINGLITVMANLVTIIIVLNYKKKGLIVSSFLLLFQILMMLIPIVKFANLASVPGIAMAIANYIVLRLLYYFLKQEMEANARFKRLADTDTLTELPNRRFLYQHLNEQVSRDNNKFAVAYIDVDNFKHVNDSLGHEVGDFVLRTVADRFRESCTKQDLIARIGGDEFAIAIHSIENDKESKDNIKDKLYDFAKNISDLESKSMSIQGKEFQTSVSIGIAQFPEDGKDTDTLLQCADQAMYHAKKNGKCLVCFYDESMLQEE